MTNKNQKNGNGFTLIEALVGAALLVVVFAGIFAAYRLGLKVVGLSKNKITATSIANAQIERIRNLSYGSVGVKNAVLPLAAGVLDRDSSETIGNTTYNVLTQVRFVSDATDGSGSADACNLDYKKADVTVSWPGNFAGGITLSTNISPKNQVQELQSCLNQPGGILSVTVFNNGGLLVPSPSISVYNAQTNNLAATATPTDGTYSFPLAADTYRVEISKTNYSGVKTYGTSEVAVPDNPNPAVLENNEVPLSLSIDLASAVAVDGVFPNGQDNFADSFNDQAQISAADNVQFLAGDIFPSGPPYSSSGFVVSNAIAPANLVAWDELRFDDARPAATDVFYQILYDNGVDWVLVPDSDLGGNSAGFRNSPVSLAGLDKGTYPQIQAKANLTTSDPSLTARIHNWQIVWTTDSGAAAAGAMFHLQGAKTIGKDALGQKVYKYSQDQALNNAGHLDIAGIDGDAYTFTVDPANGFSLIGIDPAVQPVNVAAGSTAAVKLYLRSQNSLLVTVQDNTTLGPVFSAEVRLTNPAIGYDKTLYTDQKGQAFFAPLSNGTYDISANAAGFEVYSGSVSVSGASDQIINIQQNE